jgi:hypothetical protein
VGKIFLKINKDIEMNKIKNYTSQVPVERTISQIESALIKIGVSKIEKTYTDGFADGIIFSITILQEIKFKIPANIDAARDILREIPEYRRKPKDWLNAQSRRTAWRLIYDWVSVQVAMVMLRQADAMEVFLPYAYNQKDGKTFYKRLKDDANYKLLLE